LRLTVAGGRVAILARAERHLDRVGEDVGKSHPISCRCSTSNQEWRVVAVRALTVVVGLALGALCAVGVLVAALFERDGFGDRDGEVRTAYLLALAIGLAASVGPPLMLWRMLLPSRFSWPAALVATFVAVAGVVWILGISFAA
jgi:hypothetical protein